jgi:hypothetical protein
MKTDPDSGRKLLARVALFSLIAMNTQLFGQDANRAEPSGGYSQTQLDCEQQSAHGASRQRD